MTDLIGKSGVIVHTVIPSDLATYWKNDVPVLATPILLWLTELAAIKALDSVTTRSYMTLGTAHNSRHLAPTPVGFILHIRATVISVKAKRITFNVEATDGTDIVLEGTHTRALVDRKIFETRITKKVTEKQYKVKA
mgnify:CR=1 FL=1